MLNTEQGFGLELIEREATMILWRELNDEIDIQQALWVSRDEEWLQLTGQDPGAVIVEPVQADNFYYGHRPSLIERPPKEKYPNISVMAYQGQFSLNDFIDQTNDWTVQLDVEIMCKSEESELECNRRTHRTTEAVNQVLIRNSDLNGLSLGWNTDPRIQITDIFSRPEEHGHGMQFYWQGARIRYDLTRHARLPTN